MTIKHAWSVSPRARETPTLRLLRAPLERSQPLLTLDDPQETGIYAQLVRLAVERLGAQSVLDVGCGTGLPTVAAARAGATRVVGIDIVRRNVQLAREAVSRAALERRVAIHHASWEDVVQGVLDVGSVDLVASNPPYVPCGEGSAVDGGPTGTRMLDALIQNIPERTCGIALLFGSLSNPQAVLEALAKRGFEPLDVRAQSVSFGRYTSQRRTLAWLLHLRRAGQSWFCDSQTMVGHAPHAYLTMGVIARRSENATARGKAVVARVMQTVSNYQTYGEAALRKPGFVSLISHEPTAHGVMTEAEHSPPRS